MTRAKNGTVNKKRHKKVLKLAKGYRGRASTCFRTAVQRVEKGLQYAYRDRKNRKRDFRALWIQRINAGAREHGLKYSQLINGLNLAGITLDRKILSEMAINDKAAFKSVVEQAAAALEKNAKQAKKAA